MEQYVLRPTFCSSCLSMTNFSSMPDVLGIITPCPFYICMISSHSDKAIAENIVYTCTYSGIGKKHANKKKPSV